MSDYCLYLIDPAPGNNSLNLVYEAENRADQVAMAPIFAQVHGRNVLLPSCYDSMHANVVTPEGEWLGPGGDPSAACC